LIGRDGVI